MNMKKLNLQLFAATKEQSEASASEVSAAKPFDGLSESAAEALAGKDVLLAVWSKDGSELLAISGQQGLTINRSADSIEITSKDTEGGYKSKIAGMKEWSIDNDGLYILNDKAHQRLSEAFENSETVVLKVVNTKAKKGMFAGFAVITDYPLEAPHDDAVTYSLSFEGKGKLIDLAVSPTETDTMPVKQVVSE
jgi:TP901-1 family phage major tail protein